LYNLIVGRGALGPLEEGRIFEYTDQGVQDALNGTDDMPTAVRGLPTLYMPELQDREAEQAARVGDLTRFDRQGRNYRITFTPNPTIDPIPSSEIDASLAEFGIDSHWELNRTHLAVKNIDLYRVLLERRSDDVRPSRRFLKFPSTARQEADLVAVMMPFRSEFDEVWNVIQDAAHAQGMRCKRVSDIWDQDAIIDDIASLLWRAHIVVIDLTGKNPNVFYEAGVSHTLGRNSILITQNRDDVPFDLRHLKTPDYTTDALGLDKLKRTLSDRIQTLRLR